MMPQLVTIPVGHDAATRHQRASAVPVAALRGHDLTVAERSALLDCYANSDRTFLEIATTHGVDRERLQELWFDILRQSHGLPADIPATPAPRSREVER